MTQKTPVLPHWFVTDECRIKAKIKYELNHLESRLSKLIELHSDISHSPLPAHQLGNDTQRNFKKLFKEKDLKVWLVYLVDFLNFNKTQSMDFSISLRDWNLEEQQLALNYFLDSELVNLVNAIFFYKLYPEQLFNELIHPEKLVSVRMRLSVLHQFIESVQKQMYSLAEQNGLKPGIDYLFHGNELPQGIMIEVNEDFREIIQSAVKKLKVQCTPENEMQVTLERLHDLALAYKFWFNPNRLIDAVMVLQQRLVKTSNNDELNLELFHQEMLVLYRQLTTTECLDLYGYFANNDSRYLLYTLLTIIQKKPVDWLLSITPTERNAVTAVFNALQCVMEALREALKSRHVNTEPYVYDLEKKNIHTGRRNREAVSRIIAIYGREPITISDSVEKLFSFVEETN